MSGEPRQRDSEFNSLFSTFNFLQPIWQRQFHTQQTFSPPT